jgi:hypothetical protein
MIDCIIVTLIFAIFDDGEISCRLVPALYVVACCTWGSLVDLAIDVLTGVVDCVLIPSPASAVLSSSLNVLTKRRRLLSTFPVVRITCMVLVIVTFEVLTSDGSSLTISLALLVDVLVEARSSAVTYLVVSTNAVGCVFAPFFEELGDRFDVLIFTSVERSGTLVSCVLASSFDEAELKFDVLVWAFFVSASDGSLVLSGRGEELGSSSRVLVLSLAVAVNDSSFVAASVLDEVGF